MESLLPTGDPEKRGDGLVEPHLCVPGDPLIGLGRSRMPKRVVSSTTARIGISQQTGSEKSERALLISD